MFFQKIIKKCFIFIEQFVVGVWVFSAIVVCDSPYRHQTNFQDPATPGMEGILLLHDFIWIFLLFILIFVSRLLFRIVILFEEGEQLRTDSTSKHTLLEAVWTITPGIILLFICGDSISQLYSSEEIFSSHLDVLIVGSQWFWTYEFVVFVKKVRVESHLIELENLSMGECRNLEVDCPLILPVGATTRVLVTSTDVIHSWAVPSLGVKLDAVPGRINMGALRLERAGRYYGQCSEICGKGHAGMPTVVVATPPEIYNVYLFLLNAKN